MTFIYFLAKYKMQKLLKLLFADAKAINNSSLFFMILLLSNLNYWKLLYIFVKLYFVLKLPNLVNNLIAQIIFALLVCLIF